MRTCAIPTAAVAATTARAAMAIALATAAGTALCVAARTASGRTASAEDRPGPPITLRPVGASGGASQGLAVVGDRIYVGAGEHVEVLTRPPGDRFKRVGIVDVGVGVSAVAAGDGALWVGGTDGTVKRYDLGAIDQPRLTDDLDLLPAAAEEAEASTSSVAALAVGDGRIFAALGDHGLAVIALAAGGTPRLAARLMTDGLVTDVGALGTVGYVGDGRRGLVVVDAADADHAVERTVIPFGGLEPAQLFGVVAGPVAVDGAAKRLYVAVCSGVCGFRPSPAVIIAYDVADSLAPRELARVATEYTYANDLAVRGDRAYLAITQCGPSCWGEIASFRSESDGRLTVSSSPDAWSGAYRFVTALGLDAGGALVAAQQGGGVAALTASEPYVAAEWSYVGDPAAVAFDGERMLALDVDARSLRLIEIGRPPGPRPAASWHPGAAEDEWGYDFATGTTAVAIDARRAVVADGIAGALVFDAAPATLTLVGRAELPSAGAVALRGDDAFIGLTGFEGGDVAAGVAHLDISRPEAPRIGARVPLPRAVAALSLVDDTLWALLCGTTTSIAAVDVRSPGAPVSLGPPADLDGTERPTMADGRLAVGLGEGRGIEVFDLGSGPTPRLIARLPGLGHVLGLWNERVYAARDGAVDVYRVSAAAGPPILEASYGVPDYFPTAWNPGWVDGEGRVILNRWGNGWTVLATVPLTVRRQALLPVALRR